MSHAWPAVSGDPSSPPTPVTRFAVTLHLWPRPAPAYLGQWHPPALHSVAPSLHLSQVSQTQLYSVTQVPGAHFLLLIQAKCRGHLWSTPGASPPHTRQRDPEGPRILDKSPPDVLHPTCWYPSHLLVTRGPEQPFPKLPPTCPEHQGAAPAPHCSRERQSLLPSSCFPLAMVAKCHQPSVTEVPGPWLPHLAQSQPREQLQLGAAVQAPHT